MPAGLAFKVGFPRSNISNLPAVQRSQAVSHRILKPVCGAAVDLQRHRQATDTRRNFKAQ